MQFISLVLLLSTLLAPALASQDASAAKIVLTEVDGKYVITVPASQLNLTIPRGTLGPGRSTVTEPNYFVLDDEKAPLIVSGWFSPAAGFTTIQAFWEMELPGLKRAGAPRDVKFEQVGGWNVVFFDYQVPVPGATSAHVRAHWVEAGTWIDLHLSLTTMTSEQPRARLRELLKQCTVAVKKAAAQQ